MPGPNDELAAAHLYTRVNLYGMEDDDDDDDQ